MIESALLCLAVNAYHEARGEPFQGQVAVSQVVLRRAGHDERKVCAVIRKPAQFSWVSRRPGKIRDMAAWQKAVAAAKVAMIWSKGANVVDYSNGADHYHASHVKPKWARVYRKTAAIGEHIFYRRVH